MEINIIKTEKTDIAEIKSDEIIITEVHDALDLMADCNYQGARNIIIRKENIIPEFFDLKTGIAGEILQKFSTYNVRLAIIGDFSNVSSKSLRDFIFESNKAGRILFLPGREEAINKLSGC
ncbi:MAG: DUF4180 domain-containing protein [Bacteroidales bacterium]|nr:DUF4180 domain-containing protein [Bacteroidales bacterium]